MDTKKDGGPAFGYAYEGYHDGHPQTLHTGGLSVRDWFAGQALQAFMRLTYSSGGGYMQYAERAKQAAQCSYQLADAMLLARTPQDTEGK